MFVLFMARDPGSLVYVLITHRSRISMSPVRASLGMKLAQNGSSKE